MSTTTYQLNLTEQQIAWQVMPSSSVEEILQNVKMILLTVKGTCPLDRNFGLPFDILDTPINKSAAITAAVAKAINQYEPRARLKSLTFSVLFSNYNAPFFATLL